MPTIAIVGAGPGLGLALARAFGTRGHEVALIARDWEKLDGLVGQLAYEGITAAGFPADVRDTAGLTSALDAAGQRFGGIDVLEYSPVGRLADTVLTAPSQTTRADLQEQLELQLFGALGATATVLPAMRAAGSGTLLYTTGAGSLAPVAQLGNVNAAAAALRNWAVNLHHELSGSGVYAAHVAIDVAIGTSSIPGLATAPADVIAESYWDLHAQRRLAEFVFRS